MQKTLLNISNFIIDIDTVNPRIGFYNIENKQVCFFFGFFKFIITENGSGNMSVSIQLDSDVNDITCMKEFDALKYPCRECNGQNCDER